MISVTSLIEEFCKPFDARTEAIKKAKRELTKRGESRDRESVDSEVALILEEWEDKRKRGIKYHEKLNNQDLAELPNCTLEGRKNNEPDEYIDHSCEVENNHIYLEKFICSHRYNIIGFADKVEVKRNTINVIDAKVVDKIHRSSSHQAANGHNIVGDKMEYPLEHLDDCKYNKYALQLSLYMYLLWENNKYKKVGKLYIRHIRLNDNDKLLWDKMIEVPYMRNEVKAILKYLKLNEN